LQRLRRRDQSSRQWRLCLRVLLSGVLFIHNQCDVVRSLRSGYIPINNGGYHLLQLWRGPVCFFGRNFVPRLWRRILPACNGECQLPYLLPGDLHVPNFFNVLRNV